LHGYLHKTSNSLCGIKGYASLLAARTDGREREERWARRIIDEVEQLEAIYHSVQEMAFPPAGAVPGGDLAMALRVAAERARSDHRQLVCAEPPAVPGNLILPERDLALILAELLRNSVEAAPAAECAVTVRFGIRRRPGAPERLVLDVADDGPGLPEGLTAEEAVNPFVTTKDDHLGIGLARVETIAEMHGLAWSLTSLRGVGTVVSLEVAWPAVGAEAANDRRVG
jgi:two-component system nitrogen regulation sensor histidine kinase GlnL